MCDIKVPTQDITWTVPEGGGGPKYCERALGVSCSLALTLPQLLHSLSIVYNKLLEVVTKHVDRLQILLVGYNDGNYANLVQEDRPFSGLVINIPVLWVESLG